MQQVLLGSLAALAYIAAGAWLGVRLVRAGETGATAGKALPLALVALAVVLHGMVLSAAVITPGGMNLGFFNALSLTGWLIAVVLVVAALLGPVENLGIVLLPFAGTTVVLGLTFPSERIVSEVGAWPLEFHVLISILAYSLLSLAAVQAILLAIQDHRLRSRHPAGFIRGIPPLITMESLLFQMIATGFVLLSLSLLTGFVFLEDIFGQHLVHKTVLSITAWLVFAVLLWGRWRSGWRGRTAIRWTLSGFAVLMLAYFGSKLVLELILRR